MLREIYIALKQRLQEITELKEVNWFYGQYYQEDQSQSLWTTPSLFIEFLPIQWQVVGNKVQRANLKFILHLVNESHYDNDERILSAVPNHFGLESKVYLKMMGFRDLLSNIPGYENLTDTEDDRILMESIVRTDTIVDHSLSNLLISLQQFSCTIHDYSAHPSYQNVLIHYDLDTTLEC